jgi:hypothetical protein
MIPILSDLGKKIKGDAMMQISHRANRNDKPIQLSSMARMVIPPVVLMEYSEKEVVMFRVKQNNKESYTVDIMIEG